MIKTSSSGRGIMMRIHRREYERSVMSTSYGHTSDSQVWVVTWQVSSYIFVHKYSHLHSDTSTSHPSREHEYSTSTRHTRHYFLGAVAALSALPCHQCFLTLTMSSTGTPLPATPRATPSLAAQQRQKELTIDSSPFESEISPSLAPSDSASQAPHRQRKPCRTQEFDADDLTDSSLSDEENILRMFTFRLCCPNFIFFYLLPRPQASSMDCPMLPIFWEGETAAGPRW